MRIVALLLTVLTGFTGLVYEVTWQKCLATLLGSHSEATAAVLGIFLGGLSVGYSLFGRWTHRLVTAAEREGRPPALLRFYGIVEAGIGLYALVFPLLFQGVLMLSLWLPQGSSGLGFAIDVGLTVLLIGPPTVLMGGTIPVLTQALAQSLDDATRVHAHIYAFNTVGAFAGALTGGLFLVPVLGIETVLRLMGVINLVAGVAFLWLGRRPRAVAAPAAAPAAAPSEPDGFAVWALTAAMLGFAMMCTQTVLIRVGGLSLGASHFTFAMVVAVFVLCIALGSMAVSAATRIPRWVLPASVWVLTACFFGIFTQLPDAPYWAHVLRTTFGTGESDFYPFHLAAFALAGAILAVPVGLSGASLPLLFHHLRREIGDLGAIAGRLYSWNTVGNLLGALIGGYLLLIWLDLHEVYRVGLAASLVAVFILNRKVMDLPLVANAAIVAVIAVPVLVAPSWDPARLSAGLFRHREPLPLTGTGADRFFARFRPGVSVDFYTDDPALSVAVHGAQQQGILSQRGLIVNGKPDSVTDVDYPTMALSGLLPCLMAERCERAFVIGLGTGVTAGELGSLDDMQQVDVAEISRGVIEAAPLFDFASRGASTNPRVEMIRSDAYRALLRSEGTYDIITSEPSNPWVSGVEMLFSREFLEAARSRLRPGGVYAQWFHTYETNNTTVELVLRTYLQVFDHVGIWYTLGPDMLILGIETPEIALDLDRFEALASRPDYAAGLRRAGVDSFPALLAHELIPVGSLRALDLEGPIHTLLHPRLSDVAARAFFQGGSARVPSVATGAAGRVAARNALLPQWLARRAGEVDDDVRRSIVEQVCSSRPECLSAVAWWRSQDPDSEDLAEFVDAVARLSTPAYREARLAALDRAGRLFRDPTAPLEEPISYDEAVAVTDLYESGYFAPLPYRRESLAAVWSHCDVQDERCSEGWREASERFGFDAVERPVGSR